MANIVKWRDEYVSDYLSSQNKGTKGKIKDSTAQGIDEVMYEWFCSQRAKNIPISGPILQEREGE